MSKAEERYLENFQDGRVRNCSSKEAFLLGYHQAEKDLELTVDDICEIMEIRDDVLEMDSYENLYEEILKRFNKERKEK